MWCTTITDINTELNDLTISSWGNTKANPLFFLIAFHNICTVPKKYIKKDFIKV